ncbi:HET-domain-containing protein, partial [Hyaloscypha variabilis F]
MEVNDVYRYSALKGDDTIRLIYLQPCDDLEAAIECSLKDARLNNYRDDIGDHYIAISYVWGDVNDTRSILVDEKRLTITASLELALRHVRDTQRVLRVWADGVCIDQKDVHDRNRQVRLMGDVYSIALHTIIFLGLSSPQCDAVMRMISLGVPYEKESTNNSGRSPSGLTASQFATVVEDEIFSRPWFTRVWILQELVLSQNPWLQCGQYRIRWHVFCKYVLSSQPSLWKLKSRAILMDMNESRNKFRTVSVESSQKPEEFMGSSLLKLLQTRRGCDLTDPRDMVYAHLGLVDHEARGKFPIDYDKTVAQVYESIACFYIEFAGLETAFSLVDYIQPEDRPGFLPSWVTDW